MIELGGIVILGIFAQWLASKLKIPAILPLILIGLLVGPVSTLWTEDGLKWIEPIWTGEKGLFPGESLFYFVSLAISIILFEGGLTLQKKEVLNVGPVILKLITIGTVVTFFGAAVAAHYAFDLTWPISFLFSSLIIVTGPTVISPILRNIPLKSDVSAILKWEGILIDPIGALVAVLVFEFIMAGSGGEFTLKAMEEFGKIILFGFAFGFTFAHALAFCIKKNVIPNYLLNVVILASVLGVFILSDSFAHESGLLAVVIMGMVLGNINLPNFQDLLHFKESISVLLISILFILLAANINLSDLMLVANWKSVILFACVVFLIRPIGVFLSSINSGLKTNEKVFISWVGPRGIVAAGIASLFGLKLGQEGIQDAQYITPLVFMIVLGTVILNATTARPFAKIIGVYLSKAGGVFIVGASKFSRLVAAYLKKNQRHVVVLDNNRDNIKKAKDLGLKAIQGNIYDESLMEDVELTDMGYLMALTANSDINRKAIQKFKKYFGENGAYRIASVDELSDKDKHNQELFNHNYDFISLMEVTRKYPAILEFEVESEEHFTDIMERINTIHDIIPIFIKDSNNEIHIIHDKVQEEVNIKEGCLLVYLGRPIDLEKSRAQPQAQN